MSDKPTTFDAYRNPSAWIWTLDPLGHWCLDTGKRAVASVVVNRGQDPAWRVFTRPDITGVGEIVGSSPDVEEAKAAAEAAARDHWGRYPARAVPVDAKKSSSVALEDRAGEIVVEISVAPGEDARPDARKVADSLNQADAEDADKARSTCGALYEDHEWPRGDGEDPAVCARCGVDVVDLRDAAMSRAGMLAPGSCASFAADFIAALSRLRRSPESVQEAVLDRFEAQAVDDVDWLASFLGVTRVPVEPGRQEDRPWEGDGPTVEEAGGETILFWCPVANRWMLADWDADVCCWSYTDADGSPLFDLKDFNLPFWRPVLPPADASFKRRVDADLADQRKALDSAPRPGQRVKAEISKRDLTGTVVLVTIPGEQRLAIVWDGALAIHEERARFDLLDVDPEDGSVAWSFDGEIVAPVE